MRALVGWMAVVLFVSSASAEPRLTFRGNKAIATAELETFARGYPSAEPIEIAGGIHVLYRDRGFLDAMVSVVGGSELHVVEGKRYRFGAIDVRPAARGAAPTAKRGAPFSQDQIDDDARALSTASKHRVVATVRIDGKAKTVDIVFDVAR
jgi:hypothetical protein